MSLLWKWIKKRKRKKETEIFIRIQTIIAWYYIVGGIIV